MEVTNRSHRRFGVRVDLYDAHNKGGLVEVEPGGHVLRGATRLIEALRPLVPA